MKIGLFIGGAKPQHGGGFTYIMELLHALERAKAGCGHAFVIVHEDGGREMAERFPAFEAVNLDAERKQAYTAFERLRQRLRVYFSRRLAAYLPPEARMSARPYWEDRVYARQGIEFLLQVQPAVRTTRDIPYATVLWDLQHRNNPWFPEVSAGGEWEMREAHYSLGLRRASLIYASTEQGRDEIVSYYQVPAGRIKVLRFPTPRFALASAGEPPEPEALRRLRVPKDYLLYPAQFWPHKNHVVVLEACKLIRERTGWDLSVVFVGWDHGNRDYLQGYARKLGLEQSVLFLGFVEQAELIQLYKGAFSLAFASFCGPDNLPPLEAFALGCPVVAAAAPGVREQLGEAALFFPPADEQSLADQLLSLRDPPTRARLIALGRERARACTWEDYARGMIASIDEFARIRRAWPAGRR